MYFDDIDGDYPELYSGNEFDEQWAEDGRDFEPLSPYEGIIDFLNQFEK